MRGSISCISNCHRNSIASTVRTGDAYAWTGHFNTNVTGTANGLNQLTSVGPKSLTHDSKGNVTAFGTKSFTYTSENLLLTGPGSTTLSYDPALRLYQSISGGTIQRLAYDSLDRIAEYDGSNALQRRYVHGPGMDQPILWYEGTGTTDRRFLSSDERGSIISLTDSSGALVGTGINRYDEYGNPQGTNLGAFGYTGQAWLPGPAIWYYKARVYDPELGRFLQTDPIRYEGGINLYAYVGNDSINEVDPLGLSGGSWVTTPCGKTDGTCPEDALGPPDATVFGDRCMFGDCFRPDWGWQPLTYAPPGSTSGTEPGRSKTANGKPKPKSKESACEQAAKEPGSVLIDFGNISAFAGIGITGSIGVFYNLNTGTSGFFWTAGGGYGLQLGAGFQGGVYGSVADLVGYNWSVSASGAISGSANFSASGRLVGSSVGGGAKAGGSGAATETGLFLCQLGGR